VRILISAGEASGEMYGAELIEALRCQFGHLPTGIPSAHARLDSAIGATERIEFFGVGGEKMRAAGCEIVVDAKELAVVGITEILSHLSKIWGLFHQLIAEADRRKPDLAIVIDSPAFNWRVAREMKKRGVPVVYYVCPQFWAWRQGRVRLLRRYVDKALVIFPFEEKFYRDRGVDAEFVGHPLADLKRPTITREQYAAANQLQPSKPWIALMPGSRAKELRMNLPAMLEAASRLGQGDEFLLPVAPTLSFEFVQQQLEDLRDKSSTIALHLVAEALPALAYSHAGMVASGTATVEAAMMALPFVMVYRVTPLTYFLGRSTVKVPYFAMVNLIAGKKVVPELVQGDFTPENVVSEMTRIIPSGRERSRMLAGLEEVRTRLKGPGNSELPAANRAASAILRLWQGRNTAQRL
jgi:lipid-A-disaccharide synthase